MNSGKKKESVRVRIIFLDMSLSALGLLQVSTLNSSISHYLLHNAVKKPQIMGNVFYFCHLLPWILTMETVLLVQKKHEGRVADFTGV